MHKFKEGTLKGGPSTIDSSNVGHGSAVIERNQAIAIALSEARKEGCRVPKKKKAI